MKADLLAAWHAEDSKEVNSLVAAIRQSRIKPNIQYRVITSSLVAGLN
jgi:hypothetical protein